MTVDEERVSRGLYEAAVADPKISVLSWQAVDGKGYFAADVKLRLPDSRRIEPDLVIALGQRLWLIEVKATHADAIEDEAKLAELVEVLGERETLRQVELRSGISLVDFSLELAVAYLGSGIPETGFSPTTRCIGSVIHIDWNSIEPKLAGSTLASCLVN